MALYSQSVELYWKVIKYETETTFMTFTFTLCTTFHTYFCWCLLVYYILSIKVYVIQIKMHLSVA